MTVPDRDGGRRRKSPAGLTRLAFPHDDGRWLLWRAGPSDPPAPLLLCLHGRAEGAIALARSSSIGAPAASAGFCVAIPQGRGLVADWDVDQDVVAIGDLRSGLPTPTGPCVLVGMSQGARLAAALLRDRPDAFAGLVVVAGVPGPSPAPGRGHPRLYIHGDLDPVVPVRDMVDHVAAVASDSGCGSGEEGSQVEGVHPMRADGPSAVATLFAHPDGADVTMVQLSAGGHVWPGSPEPHPPRLGPVVSWPATAAAVAFARRCVARSSG